MNWRARPLISHEVIVNLIASTKTGTGLLVHAELDTDDYPKGVPVSEQETAGIGLEPEALHADWNYRIKPK